MAAHRGSHAGSFGKGFIDSMLASMRLVMQMEANAAHERHYQAMDKWIDWKMHNNGGKPLTPGQYVGQGGEEFDKKYGGGGSPIKGEDPEMRDHIIQWSQEHGKNPDEALAVWRQESGGGTNMQGDKGADGRPSSFGDFQFHFGGINPSMPHPGMGDDFKRATGIDVRTDTSKEARFRAADFALDRASKHGWGDWATTANKLGISTTNWRDATPAEKPATTTIASDKTGKPLPTDVGTDAPGSAPADVFVPKKGTGSGKVTTGTGENISPAGGPYIHIDGKKYESDADGKIGKQVDARADTLPTNQVAGGTDEDAMRIAIEENQRLKEQQNAESPAPPPGNRPLRETYPYLPPGDRSPLAPVPRENGRVSAIPPGPTVAAQDTPFNPPPESGYPDEVTLPPSPDATRSGAPTRPLVPPPESDYPDSAQTLPPSPDTAHTGYQNQVLPARPQSLDPSPYPLPGPDDPSIIARQGIRARQQGAMPARPQSLDPSPYPEPDDPSIRARQGIRARQQAGMPARPQSLDPSPYPEPDDPSIRARQGIRARQQATTNHAYARLMKRRSRRWGRKGRAAPPYPRNLSYKWGRKAADAPRFQPDASLRPRRTSQPPVRRTPGR